MSSMARSFMKRLGISADPKCREGRKLHVPLAFLWVTSQALRGQVAGGEVYRDGRSLSDILSDYGSPFYGEEDVNRALLDLREKGVWGSDSPVDPEFLHGRDFFSLFSVEYSNFLRGDPKEVAWLVSVVVLKFFPSHSDEFLRHLGIFGFVGGRLSFSLLPRVGGWYEKRARVAECFGGNSGTGITPTDDGYISAFSKTNSPYPDQVMPGTGWIAYIGDGLNGDQKITSGNRRMAECQVHGTPVRFWRGDEGSGYKFETWVVIIQRRKRWGVGNDNKARKEFVWVLAPVPSLSSEDWPPEVRSALEDEKGKIYDETFESDLPGEDELIEWDAEKDFKWVTERYILLNKRAEEVERVKTESSTTKKVQRFFRDPSARKAVILRSRGKCENPDCVGQSKERSINGDPILEVDHIFEISKGGLDAPRNMIALCPNCHALKTRGASRENLVKKFREISLNLHRNLISSGKF